MDEKNTEINSDKEQQVYSRILFKLEQWIFFTVLIALVPLAVDFLKQLGDGTTPSLDTLISHGELALISVAIAGEIIGEISFSRRTKGGFTLLILGICILLFVLSAVVYAFAKYHSSKFPNAYVGVSLLFYLFTIGAGFGSKILLEIKHAI